MNRIKFSIYVRGSVGLIELWAIKRTPTGLYFNEVHDPFRASLRAQGQTVPSRSTSTYHEDGRSWFKSSGRRDQQKWLDTPLAQFTGARTTRTMVCVRDGTPDPAERPVTLRPEDIVLERPATLESRSSCRTRFSRYRRFLIASTARSSSRMLYSH
jgi:hypothetical protein